MDPLLAIAVFVGGLIFGSFLNVCISRIPRDESVVSPRSHCRRCGEPIAWHDNIPVLSWALLRGRCRACGEPISLRYPAVELLTAFLFIAAVFSFGFSLAALKAAVLSFLVVGLIFMDAETGLLPAEFTYSGLVAGLVLAWFVTVDAAGMRFLLSAFGVWSMTSVKGLSLLDAATAAGVGAGFFFLAWALYYLVRKRDGLGFGDIAMAAMLGAFLGLKLTLLAIFLAPVMGSVFAVGFLLRTGATTGAENTSPRAVPFGVFLGVSALIALYWGERIWRWYLGFFA